MSTENSSFYAAIGLTSQGDCYSLTRHLIDLMQSLTFVDRAQTFEVYGAANGSGRPS